MLPHPDLFSKTLYASALCLAAGALAALAMAPANLWPVLFVSLPVLYLALDNAESKRSAFLYGWLFGFAYFACSLSWIGNALLVEGNPYKWAWPLAVSGLPAVLALFIAFAALFTRFLSLRTVTGFAATCALLFISELARGLLFTGFPWNLFGYGWAALLPMVQITSIGTVYLLSALTIFWSFALGFAFIAPRNQKRLISVIALISFASCFIYGQWRLGTHPTQFNEDIHLVLVQPNIAQEDKWEHDKIAGHFAKHLELSYNQDETTTAKATYILWPETAIRDWFVKDKGSLNAIRAMLSSYPKAYLITGMLRYNEQDDTYHNSIVMIDQDGQISNIYDKYHLVPFGEYIPYQRYIPIPTVSQFNGFTKGHGPQSFETPEGLKYSPLVCYEILFPGKAVPHGEMVDFIVNVTNDAWYGISAGPEQHFTKALYRAVETDTPTLRIANTGYTGVIDPLGRVLKKSVLFDVGVQKTFLPQKSFQK